MNKRTKIVLLTTIVIIFALIIGYFIRHSYAIDTNTGGGNTEPPGDDINLLVREKRKSENNIIHTSTKSYYIYFDVELKDKQSTEKYYLFTDITLKKIADSYSSSNINAIIEKSTDSTLYTQVNEITLSLHDKLSLVDKLELTNNKTYFRVSFKIDNQRINIGEDNIDFALDIRSDLIYDYNHTGSEQQFKAGADGEYLLEVWGAQGGKGSSDTYRGGYGSYSVGTISLENNDKLYVNVGGKGGDGTTQTTALNAGGYNGGGNSYGTTAKYVGSGGGATHIAASSGLLSSLSNKRSDILIVAGGGGGGAYESATYYSTGGDAGGIKGNSATTNGSTDCQFCAYVGQGGSQTRGGIGYDAAAGRNDGSFGQGANATADSIGGGGGYYGGGAGRYSSGSGGGSGYIGNSDLYNKKMACYNCETSNEESTKTERTLCYNSTAKSDCVKQGHGYARITSLSQSAETVIRKEDELKADVVFLKVDNRSQKPLTGAKFRLWGTSDYGGTVDMETTSNNGVVTFKDVPLGEYSLKEIEAVEGYKPNTITYTVEAGER